MSLKSIFGDAVESVFNGTIGDMLLGSSEFHHGNDKGAFETMYNEGIRVYQDVFILNPKMQRMMMPDLTGRGFIIPLGMPKFMEEMYKSECDVMRGLMATYASGVDGITARAAEFATVTNGNEFTDYDVFQKQSGAIKTVTVTFPAELDSQFIRTFHTNYLDGLYDPQSGRMTLKGSSLSSNQTNLAFSAIMFTTDAKEEVVKYAVYLTNMIPENSPEDMNNWRRGEINHTELSMQYRCTGIANNKKINELAQKKLQALNSVRRTITSSYSDFDIK